MINHKSIYYLLVAAFLFTGQRCFADSYNSEALKVLDSDHDGLSDYQELSVFRTDPLNSDTDGDGWQDGEEVSSGYDPNKNGNDKIEKTIWVSLKNQTLEYDLGPYQIGKILVSTGVKRLPTPPGDYAILKKLPSVRYKGAGYDYPNTKWNLMFKQQRVGNLYIHGAYWHNKFGQPMSHGCVNVSYADMETLYNWADVGTKVSIQQ